MRPRALNVKCFDTSYLMYYLTDETASRVVAGKSKSMSASVHQTRNVPPPARYGPKELSKIPDDQSCPSQHSFKYFLQKGKPLPPKHLAATKKNIIPYNFLPQLRTKIEFYSKTRNQMLRHRRREKNTKFPFSFIC